MLSIGKNKYQQDSAILSLGRDYLHKNNAFSSRIVLNYKICACFFGVLAVLCYKLAGLCYKILDISAFLLYN